MSAPSTGTSGTFAHAFWVAAPGRGELRREPLKVPDAGEVLVRTLYSGISRGTEALVFNGRVPASEHARMRAPFQSGDFPAPVKYGYCNVGIVEAGPAGLQQRAVFSLYPHQDRYVVPADAVHVVPDGVPPSRVILAANLETAINGVWDAQVQIGDRVSIVGAGTVGCLVAWLASRIAGTDVELVDLNGDREPVAQALGVRFAVPDRARGDADVVVHASGSSEGLKTSLSLAGFESRIVELSWYGDTPVTVPLGETFHAQRLTIRSSQVGSVATSQRARWTFRRRMSLALSLLTHPELDVLITGESPFEELPQVMARLAANPAGALCHRIRYS